MQGLNVLYERTGRNSEWTRLVVGITPDVTDRETGGPLPGREAQWDIVTRYRARLAEAARDWPTATALQNVLIESDRKRAAAALAAPAAGLTPGQRYAIRKLAVDLSGLGDILYRQDDPGCLPHYQEALTLTQRIGDRSTEAQLAVNAGNPYLTMPGLRDLDQAERWFRHSLSLGTESDRLGRADSLSALAAVALARFEAARDAGEAEPVPLRHLNDAMRGYQESLALVPSDDHGRRGIFEGQVGNIYQNAGDIRLALRHYQRAIQHTEAAGDVYGAGQTRYNIALLLANAGRISEALRYARAALENCRHTGPGAADLAASAERLIAELEQRDR